MKKFKFEITLTEDDLCGDEFWEDAIKQDGTGIAALQESFEMMIEQSNLIVSSNKSPKDVVRIISYEDN